MTWSQGGGQELRPLTLARGDEGVVTWSRGGGGGGGRCCPGGRRCCDL